MRSVEITRAGDQWIEDQLGGMRSWLDREGIRVTDLHAVRILNARVTFTATFERAADADRFVGGVRRSGLKPSLEKTGFEKNRTVPTRQPGLGSLPLMRRR